MEIKEIKEKSVWESFLLECEEKTFLQSWNWGEFQKAMGNKIWRLGVLENNQLISVGLVFKIEARRGSFLFLPHAPVVASAKRNEPTMNYEVLKILLEKMKKITKEERASFVRVSPIWERNKENVDIFNNLGFRLAPIHMHPEVTWELDIRPSEEELLAGMRKTTRYLIRQGLKNKDLTVIKSLKLKDLELFNKLYQQTVKRHQFVPFSFDYLKNEVLAFEPDNQISIFLAKHKEEIISSAIVVFWSNRAFYHQGASSLKYRKIPGSYLLQWEAIKEAKRRNCKIYNFWGIVPDSKKNHPWAGLTLFKMGFGGEKKEYVKTQDFPISGSYWLTFSVEKLRKFKRAL